MEKRNAESIHEDMEKSPSIKRIKAFSCEHTYGKIREANVPREKSDMLTEMKRRHNKFGRTEL